MPTPTQGAALLEAMFSDIDIDTALGALEALGLPLEWSDASVAAVNAAANALCDQAAALKLAEAPASERRAISARVDALVSARALLFRLRPAQPGDVAVSIGGAS